MVPAAPSVVLDASSPPFYRWFADGTLNTCFNALDRHVRDGRGNQAALIYDSPVTGIRRTYTYTELRDEVARFAGVLRALGVDKGDRVIVYMPMIPEAAIAMLACARIGAVHSVVFGGFAAPELATRIDDAAPKVVVSASCGIEGSRVIEYKPILDRAIDLAGHKPDHCVILQRPQAQAALTAGRDLDWAEAVAGAEPADCVPVEAKDPRCRQILYTSGTTARPKGVVRDNGGHAVALRWTMTNIYDTRPGLRCSGPPPTSAGSWGTRTSCTRHCLPDAPPCCTRASRSAPPTRARSGGSSPSTRSRRCSPRRPRSARSRRKTRTATWPAPTTCPA